MLHEQDRLTDGPAEHQRRWAPTGRTVLVVDEAGQVGTHDVDRLTAHATAAGARVVLVGDPAQLDPVRAAGGMLALLADRLPAARLGTVHRFTQPWEATASWQLRDGNPAALAAYAKAGRIHPAPNNEDALEAVHAQWAAATTAGQSVLMMARSRTDVDALNHRARTAALADGTVHGPALNERGTDWRAGDRLLARRNNRTIPLGVGHLRNGDRFTVLAASPDGGLLVDDLTGRGRTLLPADYVRRHTAYGWASTVDAAQGATVDVGILLARPGIDREHLYVGLTCGRHANHVHVTPNTDDYPTVRQQDPCAAQQAAAVLATALATASSQQAAHSRLGPADSRQPPMAGTSNPPTRHTGMRAEPPRASAERQTTHRDQLTPRAQTGTRYGRPSATQVGAVAPATRQNAHTRDEDARRLRDAAHSAQRRTGRSR